MDEHNRSLKSTRGPYQLKQRAVTQAETRQRITEATVELHVERGPLATTISAIAERAGVQRLTVYRHFPDEASLFAACTAHYFSLHPLPDPAPWSRIRDPQPRLHCALDALYTYWSGTDSMFTSVLRDHEADPRRVDAGPLIAYTRRVRQVLLVGWGVRGRRRRLLAGVIGHATSFWTWRSLVRRESLGTPDAVDLMVTLAVRAAAGEGSPTAGHHTFF
jgi:AcrR family transcriptional regulator